jgi:hypothetical protein
MRKSDLFERVFKVRLSVTGKASTGKPHA